MQTEFVLFVYGALSEGMVHFNQISRFVVRKEPAAVSGSVYRLPGGAAAFLNTSAENHEGVDLIQGELLWLQAPDVVFKLLDEFHGVSQLVPEKSLFFRKKIHVETDRGVNCEAWIYTLNPAKLPKTAVRISQGDWRRNLEAQPALAQTLTEKQVNYIRRLNASSGREIVPIDIDLYRELMKLGLIVDKGRRLALSRLGKEVARDLCLTSS